MRVNISNETAAMGPDGNSASVTFDKEWHFTGRSRSEGKTRSQLDLIRINGIWLITGERYADSYRNGAFGRIRPTNNFSPSAPGMGAWELGLRYTNFDASDFKNGNDAGTGAIATTVANKANAYTVGLKWLPTPNTRFLLNYIQTKFDTPVTSGGVKADDEKAVTFRAQFDF